MHIKEVFFLKLTILFLCISLQPSNARSNFARERENNDMPSIAVKSGMNLVGKVLDGTTPLLGVVVSDGYTTTVTDNNGLYQLKANCKAEFVFISVPADCEIPVEDGFPKFYQPISVYENEIIEKNFYLKRGAIKEHFCLFAMADVQIGDKMDAAYLSYVDIPEMKKFIRADLSTIPLYGISLGDLVWDDLSYYSIYKAQIKRLSIPFFSVVGNHDHNKHIINNDGKSVSEFKREFGPTYYSYNIGQCHFVVLDDIIFMGGNQRQNKGYRGEITENQLKWLKSDLKYISKDKLIIVCLHIPTTQRDHQLEVVNKERLYHLLQGYQVQILSGHTHNNYTSIISGRIQENTIGAVQGGLWSGDLCNDGSPRGFAIYEFEGNQIKNCYYKGTLHSKDYQMFLYKPGRAVSKRYRDGILINIFAWNPNWCVKAYENGTYVDDLKNIREIDPRAYEAIYGMDKPACRQIQKPDRMNEHCFYYKPSSNWSTVTIEAIDPYGNIYRQSISSD
ncbi:MAG: calcineurin-like phosphoesterase family protein [Bacteroides sp.]|jgi:CRISPR/Cas system-associated endoribonuclease Cas2|nr:calcineurin-like phosphoesterase family protein [Bacteroides sp.]MCI1683331.1 calcineurin-like phosphoesterase family protein [Bacteroides sp.]